MEIKINGKKYEAKKGETVLSVCQRNGIRIPTLCHFEGLPREQVCRLCLVETNKSDKLVTSCGLEVCEGLEVKTESDKIQDARRINLELLWSDHAGKCATCYKNRRCELQNLAEEYEVENFHFVPRKNELTQEEELELLKDNLSREVLDKNNPCFEKKGSLCVECKRCINICPTKEFSFAFRSGQVKVETPYGEKIDCIFCGKCVEACPVASLVPKNNLPLMKNVLDDYGKMAVAVVDVESLENLQKEWGGEIEKREFLNVLRQLGFEQVFALDLAKDEFNKGIKELVQDSNNKYIFSPDNLSFNLFVEKYYPELSEKILEVDCPEKIMASWIKKDYARQEKINPESISLFFVEASLAKKTLQGKNGIDFVLGISEIERLAKFSQVDEAPEKSDFDKFILENKFVESDPEVESILVRGIDDIKQKIAEIKKGEAEKGFYKFEF